LENMMQLYLHDFAEFFPDHEDGQVDEQGRFHYDTPLREFVVRRDREAHLTRVDGKLAGFVLLSHDVELQAGAGRAVIEFFVLRSYRRRGLGRAMAYTMFDTYKGYWEISELSPNVGAVAFWQEVIDSYTGGEYDEIRTKHPFYDDMEIVWQAFDSADWQD
ncbi:MAG: GNAT family N-acetyltransferase, partial [Chloroflexi bacterium]|nr:GNAT family N-acetyltransferase [Chloroflexota bacterium]